MSFPPDSPCVDAVLPSPNRGPRIGPGAGRQPDLLILHYTGMATAEGALARLRDPSAEVSAHYFVFEDGRIVQMVAEAERAWHAGAAAWAGLRDINSRSIGIEIAHPGHQGGLPPYPEAQIAAVIALCRDILARNPVPASRVLAHSDVAPDRKEDPGETFPWARLAAAGIGHWVTPAPIRDGRFFAQGDAGEPVEALQAMFALYGYDLAVTGRFDAATQAVVTAFQRHFRPLRVDGVADASTITTLRDLIARRPD
ncbi:N-acetylmuramoyl-L-alanine amidase [Methylobacterium sp. Leaf118]|uniref:N-acetylmuramoyl-L-alanine amidase n=1 Tax=Methylobacterium sp. Leaf118 TaxID=2876562 RepID=UPI001E626991|nr:N-acetylmuramoyl-L-alanine amidase [Methylobacterium sp. Leaf118]